MKRIMSFGVVGFLLASSTPNLPAMWHSRGEIKSPEENRALESALKASKDQKLQEEMKNDPGLNLLLYLIADLKATHHERLTALEQLEEHIARLEQAKAENAEARIKALENANPNFVEMLNEFKNNHVDSLRATVNEFSEKVARFEIANGQVAQIILNNRSLPARFEELEKQQAKIQQTHTKLGALAQQFEEIKQTHMLALGERDKKIEALEREKLERDTKLALLSRLLDETNFEEVLQKLKNKHPVNKSGQQRQYFAKDVD